MVQVAYAKQGNPLCNLWQQCSRSSPLTGDEYVVALSICGGSARLCLLLHDLYWDERGLLLLRLLLNLSSQEIEAVTTLPPKRLVRLYASMKGRLQALSVCQTA